MNLKVVVIVFIAIVVVMDILIIIIVIIICTANMLIYIYTYIVLIVAAIIQPTGFGRDEARQNNLAVFRLLLSFCSLHSIELKRLTLRKGSEISQGMLPKISLNEAFIP